MYECVYVYMYLILMDHMIILLSCYIFALFLCHDTDIIRRVYFSSKFKGTVHHGGGGERRVLGGGHVRQLASCTRCQKAERAADC